MSTGFVNPPQFTVTINGVVCTISATDSESIVTESVPREGPQATVTFKCPWADRFTVVEGLMGSVTLNGTTIERVDPFQYPPLPTLFCDTISSIRGLRPTWDQTVDAIASDGQPLSPNGWPSYVYALITAEFNVPEYDIVIPPGSFGSDPSGLTYTTTKIRTSAEVFSPPGGTFFWEPLPETPANPGIIAGCHAVEQAGGGSSGSLTSSTSSGSSSLITTFPYSPISSSSSSCSSRTHCPQEFGGGTKPDVGCQPVQDASVGILRPRAEISMTRHLMPTTILQTVLHLIGSVNDEPITFGDKVFPRGCLLFTGMNTDPVAGPADGLIIQELEFTFLGNDKIEWNQFYAPDGKWHYINTLQCVPDCYDDVTGTLYVGVTQDERHRPFKYRDLTVLFGDDFPPIAEEPQPGVPL